MPSLPSLLQLRKKAEHAISGLPNLMIESEKIAAHIMHGIHAQKKSGSGENFWQFRDFQDTDNPHDIDWRQSAKSDHIYIRQREKQSTRKTYLWCASGRSMDYTSSSSYPKKQEAALIFSLSMALILRQSEEQVSVYGDIKTGRSEEHIQKIAHRMINRIDIESHLPEQASFTLPPYASFIGIGDFLSPINDIKESFEHIATQGGKTVIIQVLDPSEINLQNLHGRIQFQGLETEQQQIINNVPSMQNQYADIMEQHLIDIKKLCDSYDFDYVLHRTDHSYHDTLGCLWLTTSASGGRV